MWDNPQQLNRISAWLYLLVGLAVAVAATRAITEGVFPFREVTVLGARHAETQRAIGGVVKGLKGGFFTLDLDAARQAFEALPWVRQATVRRLWPNRLVVHLVEHVPAASWNGQRVLNIHGELFPVRPWPGLPRIHAPEGMQREVSRRLAEFHRLLAPAGWRIASLQVSPRYAWRLTVEGRPAGAMPDAPVQPLHVSLDLGRERMAERIGRFVTFYEAAALSVGAVTQIDLRYPNGFAVRKQGTGDREQRKSLSAVPCDLSPVPCFQTPVT